MCTQGCAERAFGAHRASEDKRGDVEPPSWKVLEPEGVSVSVLCSLQCGERPLPLRVDASADAPVRPMAIARPAILSFLNQTSAWDPRALCRNPAHSRVGVSLALFQEQLLGSCLFPNPGESQVQGKAWGCPASDLCNCLVKRREGKGLGDLMGFITYALFSSFSALMGAAPCPALPPPPPALL